MITHCPSCGRKLSLAAADRFCPACGTPLPSSGETVTSPAPAPRATAAGVTPRAVGTTGRFLPGVMLAGRYRMLGLLGRGGMGEVYRADDLKLGQPVALKFLPTDVEHDPERLDRFLAEVRTSLRVTHPNVCRVFDISEIDGRHFLSMEYVDGEDLASLLRRIGRLPEDKAVEIARQLCAGLSAAHDEGVLHRDLKPANVMIDGRGRAKIADFGLAGAAGMSGAEARAGTPQYMAPEQVSGGVLDERTDIYALGLVLYELFTGHRAFDIKDLDDLQQLASSTPPSPASHVGGLNPLVERAILRCLEADPTKRPASAKALAAALPGGDPLAMALAAGDTPSPEMVAAAGSEGGLRPSIAALVLVASLVLAVTAAALCASVSVQRAGAMQKPPDVMIERSRDIMRSVGLGTTVDDDAWTLVENADYLIHVAEGGALGPGDSLDVRGMLFCYRVSELQIERLVFMNQQLTPRILLNDPPMRYKGEVRVLLDREGRLLDLTAVPSQVRNRAAREAEVDWTILFRAAGLDPAGWVPAESTWTSWFFSDRQFAWLPREKGASGPIRVDAASVEGRPVDFHLVFPWTKPDRNTVTRRTPAERIANLIAILTFVGIALGSIVVARRNLRLDRADRRGAIVLAAWIALLLFVSWIVDEHHVSSIWEMYLALMAAGWALFCATMIAAFYLALEPYVRRIWPALIISWSRVMAGGVRNPLVARDVLIGTALGGFLNTVVMLTMELARRLTGVLPQVATNQRPFYGVLHIVSGLAGSLVIAVFVGLAWMLVLVAFRWLLRREWAAILGASVLLSLPGLIGAPIPIALLSLLFQLVTFVMLARVGLVAAIVSLFVGELLQNYPFTWPANMWYSGIGFFGVAATIALAVVAFRLTTAKRAVATGR